MKMKFNWGTGIFIVLTVFFLGIITFFIFIKNLDINLVEDNYYDKELAYQEKIDRMSNTAALPEKIKLIKSDKMLVIKFPENGTELPVTGNIHFYRPSNPDKDFKVDLSLTKTFHQAINVGDLDPGRWIIKIDWEMEGKGYYFEEALFIEQ